MLDNLNVTRIAANLAAHAGARLGLVARNIAQADTPGYKAVDLQSFAATYQVEGDIAMRATRASHFTSARQALQAIPDLDGGSMSPNGNTVSLGHEMVKSVEARQSHDMAIAIYRSAADIIRASLGRR
jgi:flagellar basal-body rod protein FlgB